jgi:hypothetical protein
MSKRLPLDVREKALALEARINAGATLGELRGRHMKHDRRVGSIEIGLRWRMTVVITDAGLVPLRVQSHEDYSRGNRPR